MLKILICIPSLTDAIVAGVAGAILILLVVLAGIVILICKGSFLI